MAQVKLIDFAGLLEKGEMYYFRAEEKMVKIYSSGELDNKYLLLGLPYTCEEWKEFLKRHNCNLERGDYKSYVGAKCKGRREFHRETEDGIQFEISHGSHVHGEAQPDIIRII